MEQTWRDGGLRGGGGILSSSPGASHQFFLLTPAPLFPFFGYLRPKFRIWHRPRPFYVKTPLTPRPYPSTKNCVNWMRASFWFLCLKKNGPLFLAKGVWKCRLWNVGSLGSASVSDSLIWSLDVVTIMHCCCMFCMFKIAVLYFKRLLVLYRSRARMRLRFPFRNYIIQLKPFIMMSLNVLEWKPLEKHMESIVPPWLFVRCFPLFKKLFS